MDTLFKFLLTEWAGAPIVIWFFAVLGILAILTVWKSNRIRIDVFGTRIEFSKKSKSQKPRVLSITIRQRLREYLQTMLVSVVVLAIAIALASSVELMKPLSVPSWIILGVRTIAVGCFIIDGIVIVAVSLIVSWRFTTEMFKDDIEKDGSNTKERL